MKRRTTSHPLVRVAVLSLMLFLVAGCSDSDNGGPQPTPDTIGPEGGTVTSDDDLARLNVPAGAVDGEITVQLEPIQVTAPPAGLMADCAYRLEWSPGILQHDVTLSISYDPADVPGGVAEADLLMYRYGDDAWNELEGCTVDIDTHEVSAVIAPASTEKDGIINDYVLGRLIHSTLPYGSSTHFLVTSELLENTCFSVPTYPLQTQTVTISADGRTVTFMDIDGGWENSYGSGVKQMTVPIDIANDCWAHMTLRFTLNCPDAEHLNATYRVITDYTSPCPADDCEYTFSLTGVAAE